MGDEQPKGDAETQNWVLVPFEQAFSRETFIGGLGDWKFPFVASGREAAIGAVVAAACIVLVLIGVPLYPILLVGTAGFFLPRLIRDRSLDGRSLQGWLGAHIAMQFRAPLILPAGKRIRHFHSEEPK